MKNYIIKEVDELIKYISQFGRSHPIRDKDFQLKTNNCWIHELSNGEIIVFPAKYILRTVSEPICGIIIRDKSEFEKILDRDLFPLENYDKNLYDLELNGIKNINNKIEYYFDYLCDLYNVSGKLNIDTIERIFSQTIGRKIKGVIANKDRVALIAISGELIRQRINGKWLLEKRYGSFNPYYVPMLLTQFETIIPVGENVLGSLKWNLNMAHKIEKYNIDSGKNKRTIEFASQFRSYIKIG